MRWPSLIGRRIGFAALVLLLAACGGDCFIPPCALPIAITLTVTAANSAGAVNGATVQMSGNGGGPAQCNAGPPTSCVVLGGAGSYTLDIGAPGFTTTQRKVTVTGTDRKCGCSIIDVQHLDVVLTPAAD